MNYNNIKYPEQYKILSTWEPVWREKSQEGKYIPPLSTPK